MSVRDGDVPEATSALIAGATPSAATLPVLARSLEHAAQPAGAPVGSLTSHNEAILLEKRG